MVYIANYHTHHPFCKHAEGSMEEYIKTALEANLKHLGFSDHAPSRLLDDNLRMSYDEFTLYLDEFNHVKHKYQNKINLYIGLEAEYLDKNIEYYRNLLQSVEYLILGQHFIGRETQYFRSSYTLKTKSDILTYQEEVVLAIKSGLFSLVAHPDIYLYGYPSFDDTAKNVADTIINASVEANVPLEYNANGIRRGKIDLPEGKRYYYPRKEFWECVAKQKKCQVIVSADAHSPDLLNDDAMKVAYDELSKLGIKPLKTLTFRNKAKFAF